METTHRVEVGDARTLDLPAESVELVVTSPPYPMVEMWDDLFTDLDPAVGAALDEDAGDAAFEAMHEVLDAVWAEVARVLVEGGIACINVGDATRTLSRFRVYRNHARIADAFEALGFDPLPDVLWRKPANSAAKFMGSGMLPPSAYVTLEHEYVLVFRKGERRSFEPGATDRYEAAYFWEERNRWFSDVWTDITGERQERRATDGQDGTANGGRERTAAFPFEIPYRLINMYSVYGDTVLDPFFGTGTTSLAAAVAARNSVGYELDEEFVTVFDERISETPALSRTVTRERLENHRAFAREQENAGTPLAYEAEHYDVPVRTKQERQIRLYTVDSVTDLEDETGYRAVHIPAELE